MVGLIQINDWIVGLLIPFVYGEIVFGSHRMTGEILEVVPETPDKIKVTDGLVNGGRKPG